LVLLVLLRPIRCAAAERFQHVGRDFQSPQGFGRLDHGHKSHDLSSLDDPHPGR
jgi:hypothetical protein